MQKWASVNAIAITFLHLVKAFDTANHYISLENIFSNYGITPNDCRKKE